MTSKHAICIMMDLTVVDILSEFSDRIKEILLPENVSVQVGWFENGDGSNNTEGVKVQLTIQPVDDNLGGKVQQPKAFEWTVYRENSGLWIVNPDPPVTFLHPIEEAAIIIKKVVSEIIL